MDLLRQGRNTLCRCRSGKKYKKCCLRGDQLAVSEMSGMVGDAPWVGGTPTPAVLERHGVRPKRVKRVFERTGRIVELHVGGQLIRTTPEHPFYVHGRGWTEVGNLHPGDLLRTESGWVTVDKVVDTGRYEKVYNVEVEDDHTYFVGGPDWGFSVWAHNSNCAMTDAQLDAWIQAHVQVPAETTPPTGSVRSIVESLPARSGTGPVSGILIVNGKAYHLASLGGNQSGWSAVVTDSARRYELVGNMGVTQDNYRHLEVTAALVLRKLKLQGVNILSAALYENQKPCEYGTRGCHPNMGRMLLPGVQLKVDWPDPKGSYRLGPPGTSEYNEMRVGEVLYRETDYAGGQASPPLRVPGNPGNVVDRNPGQVVPAP